MNKESLIPVKYHFPRFQRALRKERLDKLRKYISERLEKDGNLDVRKFVAKFSIENDISSRTVKDYIYTLRDAESARALYRVYRILLVSIFA